MSRAPGPDPDLDPDVRPSSTGGSRRLPASGTGPAGRRPPPLLRYLLVALLAVLAGASSASASGATSHPLGPLQAEVGLAISWSGGTRVAVPPLGMVSLDTHRGPLQIRATVTDVRPEEAREPIAGDRAKRASSAARLCFSSMGRSRWMP